MTACHHHHRHDTVSRVTFVSAGANALLGIFKVGVGIVGYSHALIADGIHSFADLLTDALVLIASKASQKSPDSEHPYGHGRIETLATTMVATMLVMVGLTLAYNVIMHAIHSGGSNQEPTLAVFIVAVVSILVNEALFRYGIYFGKKINSALVSANAWHHRSDGLVSVIVLVSVLGEHFHIAHLDEVGAVVIAGLIVKMGAGMIWQSLSELIDTGVSSEMLEKIKATILDVHGVVAIHLLRTRSLGAQIFVDVHVLVDPKISVSEGHYISDRVWFALRNKFDHIHDVVVHVDPEDDEVAPPSSHLPDRIHMEQNLHRVWAPMAVAQKISRIQLHYCSGHVDVEVYLPVSLAHDTGLAEKLISLAKEVPGVGSVDVYYGNHA